MTAEQIESSRETIRLLCEEKTKLVETNAALVDACEIILDDMEGGHLLPHCSVHTLNSLKQMLRAALDSAR